MPPLLKKESSRADASQMPRLIIVDQITPEALQTLVIVPPPVHNMTFGSNLIVGIGRVVLGFRRQETLRDSA